MTRKAIRKRRQLEAKQVSRSTPTGAPWVAVGALMAPAALGGARPVFAAPIAYTSQDAAPEQTSPAIHFEIPSAPLGDVVVAFQRLTSIHITLALDSRAAIESPGISGTFSVEEALRAMVAGTGARFRFTSPTTAVLELVSVTEAVDVTGRAPGAVVTSTKYTAPLHDVPQF